jgi:hypothetical protein
MTYNGGNYLFIQTKKAVSTVVDLPAGYTNHVYSVWHTDKTQSATTHSGKAPIKLVSKAPAQLSENRELISSRYENCPSSLTEDQALNN